MAAVDVEKRQCMCFSMRNYKRDRTMLQALGRLQRCEKDSGFAYLPGVADDVAQELENMYQGH